jgi:hypothetical protein
MMSVKCLFDISDLPAGASCKVVPRPATPERRPVMRTMKQFDRVDAGLPGVSAS